VTIDTSVFPEVKEGSLKKAKTVKTVCPIWSPKMLAAKMMAAKTNRSR